MARTRSKTKTSSSRSRAKTKTTASRSRAKTKTTATRSRAKAKTATSRRRGAQLRSLEDVLTQQLADLYSAERKLVTALPKVARAATHPELKKALQHHLDETKGHVRRLQEIFRERGTRPPTKQSKGMTALIQEGEEVIAARGDDASRDAALIAAAQRVEHYEIAAYGTARTLADELGLEDARSLLDETLKEESNADELLTKLATGGIFRSGINKQAAD